MKREHEFLYFYRFMPFLRWAGLYHKDDGVVEETLTWSQKLWAALERLERLRWDHWDLLEEWRKGLLFSSNIWQREIFVGLQEGTWQMPIPAAVLEDVKGSHGAPCTTKDAEDMLNVERANMHHGSLHMGQPAIFHRAIN